LLDEVVAGLPTVEAIKLAMLLKRLPEWGISAIGGIEHVMQVVMKIADRVIVIDRGVLIAEGKPQEVVDRPEVIEAYLGPKYKEIGLERSPSRARAGARRLRRFPSAVQYHLGGEGRRNCHAERRVRSWKDHNIHAALRTD